MKKNTILYVHFEDSATDRWMLKILTARYSVQICNRSKEPDEAFFQTKWELVIVSDAHCFTFFRTLCKKLKKYPFLFISARNDIGGYVAPWRNLMGVIKFAETHLSPYGIPEEIQRKVTCPVEKVADYYLYEKNPEEYRVVYCPTRHTIGETDRKIGAVLQQMNVSLDIVTDFYEGVKEVFPSTVRILPQRAWFSAYRQAHLVIASGEEAVRALALRKTCIVLGDYGLGGLVNSETYESLKAFSFQGRNGAAFGEYIPIELLDIEIRKALTHSYREELAEIQKEIAASRNPAHFKKVVYGEVDRILFLLATVRNRKKRWELKPRRTSVCKIRPSENGNGLMRGLIEFGEIDGQTVALLEQCDGLSTVGEIVGRNGCDAKGAAILWENLLELWKEKLIVLEE